VTNLFPQIRRVYFDNSYQFSTDDGFRHEIKYTLNQYEYLKFRDYCASFMDCDKNAGADGGYVVKSYYFDTLYYNDYTQKLNGVHDRKKYRVRTYGDTEHYKLEKKVKRGNLNKKFSGTIAANHADLLLSGRMDIKTGDENADAIISEMYLSNCRNSVYIEYTRQAFLIEELDLRVTFDSKPGVLYGKYNLNETKPDLIPFFYDDCVILEIKYKDVLPRWIEKAVHRMVPSEFSISKYVKSLEPVLR